MRKYLNLKDIEIALTSPDWVGELSKRVDFLHSQEIILRSYKNYFRKIKRTFLCVLAAKINNDSDKELLPYLLKLEELDYPFSSKDLEPYSFPTYIADERKDKNWIDFYSFLKNKNVDFDCILHRNSDSLYAHIDESSNINVIEYFEQKFEPIKESMVDHEMYFFGHCDIASSLTNTSYYTEEEIEEKLKIQDKEKREQVKIKKILKSIDEDVENYLSSGCDDPVKDKQHLLTNYIVSILETIDVETLKSWEYRLNPCYKLITQYIHKHQLDVTLASQRDYAKAYKEEFSFYCAQWFDERQTKIIQIFEKRLGIKVMGTIETAPQDALVILKTDTKNDFQKYIKLTTTEGTDFYYKK